MRSEYGKLVYLLMDSADGHIQELIEFRCVRPLRTVYSTLGALPSPCIVSEVKRVGIELL